MAPPKYGLFLSVNFNGSVTSPRNSNRISLSSFSSSLSFLHTTSLKTKVQNKHFNISSEEEEMWRSSGFALVRTTTSYLQHQRLGLKWVDKATSFHPPPPPPLLSFFCTDSSSSSTEQKVNLGGNGEEPISFSEAKRLMRLVNVEALKRKLGMEGEEVISYCELLKAVESMGVARSVDEAKAFVNVLDEAGVILLFRDKAYLHPDKVVDLVRKAVPLALAPDDDPRKDELKMLQKKKEEIDIMAHKQVRRILWSGLGFSVVQVGLFFRLTFWEFSWDVMEPIAFFTTTTGLVVGYAYFLFTSRDPTYQDLMKRLFLSRQRKLFKQQNFDIDRLRELQKHCNSPLDGSASSRGRIGLELGLEDSHH